jgi:hypothetical protein
MARYQIKIVTKYAAFFLLYSCLLAMGCSKETPKLPPKKVVTGHGGTPVSTTPEKDAMPGTIMALKVKKLASYPQLTIGEAFDAYRYFDKKEWRETRAVGGKIYIDFTGLGKPGSSSGTVDKNVVSRGVDVKFIIYLNGDFMVTMVSKLEIMKDGKSNLTPFEDKKQILDAIYGNKEITF